MRLSHCLEGSWQAMEFLSKLKSTSSVEGLNLMVGECVGCVAVHVEISLAAVPEVALFFLPTTTSTSNIISGATEKKCLNKNIVENWFSET
jgi:hypothetical protein